MKYSESTIHHMNQKGLKFQSIRHLDSKRMSTKGFVNWLVTHQAGLTVSLLRVSFSVPTFISEIGGQGLKLMPSSDGLIGAIQDNGKNTDLSKSSGRFVLHTDGPYHEVPPKIVILHCLRPGQIDVRTILRDTSQSIESLSKIEREILMCVHFIYTSSNGVKRCYPLIQCKDGEWYSNFGGKGYLQCVNEQKYDFFTWNTVAHKFISSLYDPNVPLLACHYEAGDTLVFNNHRYLHGRENLNNKPDYKRKLLRIWLEQ